MAQPDRGHEPPLDPAAFARLDEVTGGEAAAVADLIDTFLEDSPQLLSTMKVAASGGDAAALRLAAHSLKSNSLSFGALTLGELCGEVEAAARGGRPGDLSGLLARVEAEYARVDAALRAARLDGCGGE